MTSVGMLAVPVLVSEMPQASIRAGPPLTTSVLPSMEDGIGLTCTLAFEADARSRAASKVNDPVAWETTP